MKIVLTDAGKRYNHHWVFRHFTYTFESNNAYAITGPNGSGKSTLLQMLSGAIMCNEGHSQWQHHHKSIAIENVYKHIAICAPYIELVEEFTLVELLNFHQSFKPFLPGFSTNSIIATIQMEQARNKRISQYSSGMKQRVKLAQCIFSDAAVLLLDEPCTNLDQQGIDLYHHLIHTYGNNRLLMVSSNDKTEYTFCNHVLNMSHLKHEV